MTTFEGPGTPRRSPRLRYPVAKKVPGAASAERFLPPALRARLCVVALVVVIIVAVGLPAAGQALPLT